MKVPMLWVELELQLPAYATATATRDPVSRSLVPTDGLAYSALLKNELLGAGIEKVQDPQTEDRRLQPSTPERKGLFTYSLSTKRSSPDDGNDVSPYSLSPVSNKR